MASNREIVEEKEIAPDELLVGFSHGRIIMWMAIAAAIHVVLIGVTSVSDIRDRLDPEGAKTRKEAAAAAEAKLKEAEKLAHAPKGPGTNSISGTVTNMPQGSTSNTVSASAGKTNSVPDEAAMMAARTNSPIYRKINETAGTNELPKQPTLGISLDDTQVH